MKKFLFAIEKIFTLSLIGSLQAAHFGENSL
jgi:hypothetical protein